MTTGPFVPIEDLAKHFTVAVTTARAWVRQGLIPPHTYIKVGNTYRFDLNKVVEALMPTPQPAAQPESSPAPAEDDTPVQLELDFTPPDPDQDA
jgi:hypothetical protein